MAGISKEERARRAALAAETQTVTPLETGGIEISSTMTAIEVDEPTAAVEPQKPPMFSVAERRLKFGDAAMLKRQADFDLVGFNKPMATYWGTTDTAYDLINVYGWEPVNQKYLPMKAEMLGLSVSPEGYVTRGAKGSEMLFMMPKETREAILHKQSDTRIRRRLSARGFQQAQHQAAQNHAADPSLSQEQRDKARRHADSLETDKRARWVPLESHESHGTEPL